MLTGLKKLLCLLLAAAMLISLSACAAPEVRALYRQGNAAMKEGQYAEAAACFASLENYRDSARLLEEIMVQAQALYDSGEYARAGEIFAALADAGIEDAALYAQLAQAQDCLEALDAAGALAALEGADGSREEVLDLQARIGQMCFADTVLVRPEYVASELADGRIVPEIDDLTKDPHLDEIVYLMSQNAADSVYAQYRDYCLSAFPESFEDGSDSYFTIQLDGATCYVCNYWALYGGLLIKIPRY